MTAVKMPVSGLTPDAIAKRHRQRQRHDADGEPGGQVGKKIARRIIFQRVHQLRSK